ncbi:interleukin-1 receptor-associated kinase 3 [Pygocentrus nattereri]|uniref:non-specific serine/threonine protein kinase n=1 Tax=Pygocentrus nattereri TaxID=42514 RepID=A0A3B4BV16_PYGNA|nr:interleukin-1 receptor-associated kinase 3 [Pygocentrus nattereri]
MSGKLDPSTYLFDVPPLLMESFCKVMDSCSDSLGWRGLAARVLPNWLDVRHTELHAAAGRSPTRELVWSWAQQNKTVGDLVRVLEDMGHYRALNIFQAQDTPNVSSTPIFSKCSQSYSEEPSSPSGPHPDCVFGQARNQRPLITYAEVVEGTKNFHQDLKIGQSTFSEIYRGRRGNESFAVKVFKQENRGYWKALWEKFKTEIEVLRLCQHPNILELWGSFSEGEHYCLVSPFLPNGSLFSRLHSENTETPLSWKERLDIIKGTAKAVHYLHTAQPCMVICGNIKSSNILLDEHLQPKLSDFGMARLRPHSVNQSCTISMETTCRSNLGYLPEEYIRDGKLSVKLDIYSLGMVILEICTGQKVIQETPKHTLLRDKLSLEAEEKGCVDACLCFMDSRAGQWPIATALCLLRLGLECTSSRARARPSMDTVLQKLSQLLPLPFPPEDQPRTLDDTAPPLLPLCVQRPGSSLPVENDEMCSPLVKPQLPLESGPCECSQSEVTFLSTVEQNVSPSRAALMDNQRDYELELDLYGSCPVECSCAAGAETQSCEDCCANGFSHTQSHLPTGDESQSCQSTVENPAKRRLKNKIQMYKQGTIKTEELLSMTSE